MFSSVKMSVVVTLLSLRICLKVNFNLFDIDGFKKDNLFLFIDVMETLKLQTVPILDMGFTLPDTIEELIEMADGKSILNTDKWREGIVIRSHDNEISFKVISNKFLLKEK